MVLCNNANGHYPNWRNLMPKHDKPIAHKTTGKGKTYNPTDKGAGMTAKGRAEYNAKNNANLKPPAPILRQRRMKGVKPLSVQGWRV
jgi:hypothetical protein